MRYRCRHVTRYDYGDDVPVSHHLVHLRPRPHPRQRVQSFALRVTPSTALTADHDDHFGNPVSYVAVQEPHRRLTIVAESEVEVSASPILDLEETPAWEDLVGAPGDAATVAQFAFNSTLVTATPNLADFARSSFGEGRPVAVAALDLMRRIHRDFTFDPTATTVTTPLAEVLQKRRGVCQDFAHLLVGGLRSMGLAARYVSGYLRTLPPPGQPRLVGADVSHAWVSVWCGGETWLDLCPTNGQIADRDYITVAWGRDYDDVSPVRGIIVGGAGHGLTVSVDVEPIED
ncbi:transglutaminase family protein [Azospirillum sp. TSO22-1]|uniref:transglutaminase family protein n=1 Tax=Azospirillum sp. TSO22-1 TaxID=716789 RepID=UPI000D615E35|nr:transglutaminase family protein [Azospirillum sp. TSO22-1]PWC55642.1 transglutaminase [Azospirillum sp. TSO22-1]